ncbi:MAG: DUF1176 domain-containing protein [Bdellovibrionales bacterium]|nr:DUF1176 domain-containing protein [Bdellovibrionales bacterium]
MKTKLFLALALSLTATLSSASEISIPKDLLERHSKACPEFTSADRGEYMTKESYKLPKSEYGSEKTLFVLGCEMYAYNSREAVYLVDSYGEISSVAVAEVDSNGSITATTDLMGTYFDLETLTLSTYQKGRGMGDCGSSATYKYDKYSSRFILTEARLKDSCDGGEDEWPIVYKK